MTKRVFLAGATGAIGKRLAPLLLANGWKVIGSTRSESKMGLLREMGVEPCVVDVFNADLLKEILEKVRPEIVIHQLTDLPYALAADQMTAALKRNARLRDEGTRNLVDAANHVKAKRIIAQSISFIYSEGSTANKETDPLLSLSHPVYGETVKGVMSLEEQIINSPMEGIVLRYGLLYGPGTGFDKAIAPGSVHVDAAAKACELAVLKGERGIYNVAESDGTAISEKVIKALNWDANWRSKV